MALRYVERFATSRGRLAAYLRRKIRERGWQEGEPEADPEGVAERMARLGYVDDRAFAEARATAMGRRGLGARRVSVALRHDGIGGDDAEAAAEIAGAATHASAIAFARRRRIGPYAREAADLRQRERHVAAMVRAGHAPGLARRIAAMAPGDDPESLLDD